MFIALLKEVMALLYECMDEDLIMEYENSAAKFFIHVNEKDEAIHLLLNVLRRRKNKYGDHHFRVGVTMVRLASLFDEKDRPKVFGYAFVAQNILTETLGKDHTWTHRAKCLVALFSPPEDE